MDAFDLDSLPKSLRTESAQRAIGISPSKVVPNEHYVVRGPKVDKIKKKIEDRSGNFL